MDKHSYSVTTVGLNAHDETIVRSVLNLIEGSTRDKWEYTESFQADLVLCDPEAALTRIAIKQFQETGRPVCVAVLKSGQTRSTLTHFIHFPVRASEIIGVLDNAADEIEHPLGKVDSSFEESPQIHGELPVPDELQDKRTISDLLMAFARRRRDEKAAWQINLDGKCIYVFEPERTFASSIELNAQRLNDLASATKAPALRRVGGIVAKGLRKELAPRPIDELLWNLGLNQEQRALLPALANAKQIRLQRWPDFGRLGARKSHFAFAALLTRTPQALEAIPALTGQPQSEVYAFLNACALCNLLEYTTEHDTGGTDSGHMIKVQPSRWSGLVRIMRSALGMETRAA